MQFEFVQTQREFAWAWLVEYYRGGKWGPLRIFGGPAMAYLGWRMHLLRPGEWVAALGSFAIGFGIYYAAKPLLQVALLSRRRRKLGAERTSITIELDDDGIAIRSGKAATHLGWDEVVRVGWRSRYFWFELAGGNRAIIPLRAIRDRDALDELLRQQGKLGGGPVP